jgi:hypothetical protein
VTRSAKLRGAGQLPLVLDDTIAQEIRDYRHHRLGQGGELPQIDQETARRFGPDLGAFAMDEVGTPPMFPS